MLRSIEAFKHYQGEASKFDYFICGTAGAVFAYVVQNYVPQKLGLDASLITPVGLVLLAASFWSGLKRIEWGVQLTRMNSRLLHLNEVAGKMTKALSEPTQTGIYYNAEGAEVFDREGLEATRKQYLEQAEKLESAMGAPAKETLRYYKLRNAFLLLGFFAIFLAKVLQPYQTPRDPQRPASTETPKQTQPLSTPAKPLSATAPQPSASKPASTPTK